jgi:hypothetical protein
MTNHLNMRSALGRFFAGVEALLPLLSADEQTRLSWARVIKSLEQVPEAYRGHVEALLPAGASFPYMVLAPAYRAFGVQSASKLLFCLSGDVCVVDEVRGRPEVTCCPIQNISHIEVGVALLHAWVRLSGTASDGAPFCSEFRFNAVTDYLFTPIVDAIRSAARPAAKSTRRHTRRELDHLRGVNLKLVNYARRCLAPGDRVIQTIYQPEIRAEVLRVFNRSFYRTLSAPHLAILTTSELILIQDGAARRVGRGVRHGGIWTYIPLSKISALSLADGPDDRLTLTIHLPGDERVDMPFSASMKSELDVLLSSLKTRHKAS